jgi:uncharacterized protein
VSKLNVKAAIEDPRDDHGNALANGVVALGNTLLKALHLRAKPVVYRREVTLPQLPPALEGLRIVQLSDLHRSLIVQDALIERSIELAMAQNPDIIFVTGDFVTGSAYKAYLIEPLLARLRAPLGVWGVLGNHDHWTTEVERVIEAVERAGVRLLNNDAVELEWKGAPWWLVGVDDMCSEHADLEQALHGVPSDSFRLLLSHCPDLADEAARYGIPLQLSGHSHGGQIGVWPWSLIRPRCGKKYPWGLHRVPKSDTWVYTNVGIGVVSIPLRVRRPPEVTLMTLHRP